MSLSRQDLLNLLDGKNPFKHLDWVDQHRIVFKCVELLRAEPDMDMSTLCRKSGLNRTEESGLIGSYCQLAREIIKRDDEEKI